MASNRNMTNWSWPSSSVVLGLLIYPYSAVCAFESAPPNSEWLEVNRSLRLSSELGREAARHEGTAGLDLSAPPALRVAQTISPETDRSAVQSGKSESRGAFPSEPLSAPVESEIGKRFLNSQALGRERAAILIGLNGGKKSTTLVGENVSSVIQRNEGQSAILKLDEAITACVAHSNEIAGAQARSKAAGYFANAAASAYLPHVDIVGKTGEEQSSPSSITDPTTTQKVPSDTHRYREAAVKITQALVDVPAVFEYARQSSIEKSSHEAYLGTQARVTLEAISSYFRLIETRIAQIHASEYESSLKALLEWITTRSGAGASSPADRDRVRARVVGAKAKTIEAQALLEAARVQFRRLSSLEPTSIDIPDSLLPDIPADVESGMKMALDNNRELRSAVHDTEAVRHEGSGKKSQFLPKLGLQYTDTRVFNAGGVAANPSIYGTSATQHDRRILLVASINLFSGGDDLNQARALAEKKIESQYRVSEIRRRLDEAVRINYETLTTIGKRIDAVREEVDANQKVANAFNEQLVLANRPLLDVLDAFQRLYESKVELNRLVIAEATVSHQLLFNIGVLNEPPQTRN